MNKIVLQVVVLTVSLSILDYISGLLKAVKEKEFNSSILREGGIHKLGNIIAIVLGLILDKVQVLVNIGLNKYPTYIICGYIIIMEVTSIIENIGKINPSFVPKQIREVLFKLK